MPGEIVCSVMLLTINQIKGDTSSLLLLDEIQIDLMSDVGDQWEVGVWMDHGTLVHEGFARLVASVALLDEVLGHPVGPGGRESILWCFVVLPYPRALADIYKLSRVA